MPTSLSCTPLYSHPCASFHADPSGTFIQYDAKAIGAGSEVAQAQLLDEYTKNMSLQDAKALAVKILKQVMEDALSPINIELATITPSEGFCLHEDTELATLVLDATVESALFALGGTSIDAK